MKDEFVIESDVPIPSGRRTRIYNWHLMKVGDSVKIPLESAKSALGSAYVYGMRQEPEWIFTQRKISATQVRIWRIS